MLTHSVSVAVLVLSMAGAVAGQELTAAQEAFHKGYTYHTGEDPDLDMALRYYHQAVKLDPSLFPALTNMALIYYGTKSYTQAKHYYSAAIKAARLSDGISVREEAKVSSDLGGCFYQEGNLSQAEKWFRAATAQDPGLVEGHYNLINLLLKEDRREEARQAMALAARVAPSTRYGLFEGRLRGKQSWDEWSPAWVKVIVGGLLLGIIGMTLYRWLKTR